MKLSAAPDVSFPAYDPKSRYLTMRGSVIDPNPRFVRIVLEIVTREFELSH